MTATADGWPTPSGVRPRRFRLGYEERNAYAFLAPLMAVLFAVAVFPILYSLYLSFFDVKLTRPSRAPFVGLENYYIVLSSGAFWISVQRTVVFTVVSVLAIAGLGLLIAILLNENFRGRRVLSAVLLIPWAIPYVANGLMWKWIYDSGYGALNGLLLQLGFINSYMIWLGDPEKTLPLIAQAFVWKEVPLATVLLLVGLKAIPEDHYAAARVDGANLWQRFVHVTLPSLRPAFMLVFIYETLVAIRHFDLFFLLTEGGPGTASHVLSWHIYVETFRSLSFGTGSAMAYLLAMLTFALAWIIIRFIGRRL